MKKSAFKIFVCLLCLIIVSCSSINNSSSSKQESDASFERIPLNEAFNQKNENYYILVFSPSCLACQSILEVLAYKNKKESIDLFLIDFHEVKKDDNSSNVGVNDYSKISYISVPLLLIIENKTIINEIYGFETIRDALV